ncbi:MAG: hypothetical protein NUV77_05495 [Thermoguttaceae bacterium]|jgi:hypothetical protein|nr:hypothetical protein [Thermoguttaceae bacterium]
MADNLADASECAEIRRLACDPMKVRVTKTVEYDLLAHHLTKRDVCDEIVAWIESGHRVKKVTLRGQHAGQAAFEMKPRINNTLFYLKLTLCELGQPGEYVLLISVHPDH